MDCVLVDAKQHMDNKIKVRFLGYIWMPSAKRCLLRSLPADVILDNSTGFSFTCDLTDNIAAPWPSSSSVSSVSLCAPEMSLPALPTSQIRNPGNRGGELELLCIVVLKRLVKGLNRFEIGGGVSGNLTLCGDFYLYILMSSLLRGTKLICVLIRQQVITGGHYVCGACFYVHPMQVKQVTHFAALQMVVRLDSRDGVKRKVWAARLSGIGLNSVSPSEK
ncbi:hypothetical protein NC653_037383 [Populus alba x Populus x berolinensis]|uniref:Uncharacterized protein n=1 Tax=Populus alba x Populus x berolinensis TaxID=444605 RepID=A0AAD6LE87_9ROSI|nr:hypothetical protein NC653_037383 [Populus alba x Populus x berolinensis]